MLTRRNWLKAIVAILPGASLLGLIKPDSPVESEVVACGCEIISGSFDWVITDGEGNEYAHGRAGEIISLEEYTE